MPRINIEDRLFSDHRFILFNNLVGDQDLAIGLCYRFFRMAQGLWCPNKQLIPTLLFDSMRFSKEFEKCGLAIRKKRGIYVSGTNENAAWLMQKFQASHKAMKSRRKMPHRTDHRSSIPVHPPLTSPNGRASAATTVQNTKNFSFKGEQPIQKTFREVTDKDWEHQRNMAKEALKKFDEKMGL